MNPDVERFSELAREFISWAESPATNRDEELTKARTHIAHLYAAALSLPDLCTERSAVDIQRSDREGVFKRFGALPFNYYTLCSDPHNVPGEKPVVADLADDLTDIWSDIKRGLTLYDSGDCSAAVWEWRFAFLSHWGEHAASALYAIHCWKESV